MFRRWVLPMLITILALFSLITLRSIAPPLLSKQMSYFLIGGMLFFLTMYIPFEKWHKLGPYLYVALIILLLITQLIGRVTRGATSWIPIGSFHVQPSQLAVVWVGLWLSNLLSHQPINRLSRLVKFILIVGLPAFLIFIQPELGTTVVFLAAMGSLFFLAKTKPIFVILTMTSICLFSLIAWMYLLKPYQKERITSFINSQQSSAHASYNAQQSVIAVGSGQWFGRGIGQGVQSHLRFLPERQTDFAFASFAEEVGFLGAFPVIVCYAALIFFLLFVGLKSSNEAEQYFCLLTATMIAVQSGINIGMNMSLLPITGITLPFFSYGGSSILSLCFQLGCIQSILLRYRKSTHLYIK